jgi:hypothetical protein
MAESARGEFVCATGWRRGAPAPAPLLVTPTVQAGASSEVRGAAAVAETFSGRARAAQPALVNGAAGLVWLEHGRPRVVFGFTITRGKIVGINLVADPEHLDEIDLEVQAADCSPG